MMSSGTTTAIHQGSHGFWRKTTWLGISGAWTAGGACPAGILRSRRLRLTCFICGPRTCGARNCGWRTWIPPGPMLTPGSKICPLSILGPYMPGMSPRPRLPSSSTSLRPAAAAWMAAASSPLFTLTSSRRSSGRPIQICFGGRTTILLLAPSPGAMSTAAGLKRKRALVVRVRALEGEQDGGVGRVLHAHVELGLAAPGRALRLERRGVLLERLDPEHHRLGGRRAVVRARVDDDGQRPDPRLGLRGARRVQVDLDLLLVRAAAAERGQVDHVRVDGPPVVRHALHGQLVVVDDAALVAHHGQHAHAAAGVHADGHRPLVALRLLVRQAQRERRALGLLGRGDRGLADLRARRRGRRRRERLAAVARGGGGGPLRRGGRGRGRRRRGAGGRRLGRGCRGPGRRRGGRPGWRGGGGRLGGRRRRGGGRGRRDGLLDARRLPAQVLPALAEVAIERVLEPAARAGPHPSAFRSAFTRSR